MPDKTSPESTEPVPSGGGSKRMIMIGALCALICAAGFVLGGRMSGGAAAAPTDADADAEAEPEEVEPTIDEIVELEPLNVNLAEGHYLRIAVAIGITHVEGDESSSGSHGATDEEPPIETAPASDLVLSTFSGRALPDLSTLDGRESARHDLHEGLVDFYGEEIVTVLFTEFVMQ